MIKEIKYVKEFVDFVLFQVLLSLLHLLDLLVSWLLVALLLDVFSEVVHCMMFEIIFFILLYNFFLDIDSVF